jgi:competence protein ComEC
VPLIFSAYLALVTGLIAGFTHAWLALTLPATLVLWLWSAHPPATAPATALACAALSLAGMLIALTSPPPTRFKHERLNPHAWLDRQRLRANRTIDSVFRTDAPIAKALLIANQHEIDKSLKRRYADAGIIHMLSISGLHVAIVASTVELLATIARLPIRLARLSALSVIALYVAIIGFPPPAVRSGMMVGASSASALLQRPISRWTALALGALPPLIVPATAVDIGYQLSVLGIAGLIASGALAKQLLATVKGWRASIARALLASTVATLVSAPLVAWAFGRISLIAPVTNLIADPILGLAQPMLFLALLAAPCLPLARFIADAVHPLLVAFNAVATWGAAVPHAALAVHPSPLTLACAGIASTAMIVACISRFPARATLIAASALSLAIWSG